MDDAETGRSRAQRGRIMGCDIIIPGRLADAIHRAGFCDGHEAGAW